MNSGSKKVDWSEGCWRERLIDQRRFMWHEDTIRKLAAWLNLRPGMTLVDVGCGLGYLGYTCWPFFGQGGIYFGVDVSLKLAREAAEAAGEWAVGGEAVFAAGDAYGLPLSDNFADLVMCQAVLMHLENPRLALSEMIRVAKPGGMIMCIEPDHLSGWLSKPYLSLPQVDIDVELLLRKVHLISNKGRIKLGRGDNSIGSKLPSLMRDLGLRDIDVRLNDKVGLLMPPYESTHDRNVIRQLRKRFLNRRTFELEMKMREEEFLAGGGDPQEYERYREIESRTNRVLRQQIESGEYSACFALFVYIMTGRKLVRPSE